MQISSSTATHLDCEATIANPSARYRTIGASRITARSRAKTQWIGGPRRDRTYDQRIKRIELFSGNHSNQSLAIHAKFKRSYAQP